jgi:hypothetical protein
MSTSAFRLRTLAWSALVTLSACATQNSKTEGSAAEPLSVQTPAPKQGLEQQLEVFKRWFAGEWDNNEQVWQQKQTPEEQRKQPLSEHTHHVFAPVSAPKIGAHTFFVEQYLDGDASKVYRRRLYSFEIDAASSAIRLDIYSFKDDKAFAGAHKDLAKLAGLSKDALTMIPECAVFWRFDAAEQAFNGTMPKDACRYRSERLGKTLVVNDTLKLSEQVLSLNDQITDEQGAPVFGVRNPAPLVNRKVRYFDGWAVINRALDKAGKTDTKYRIIRPLRLHNEGQVVKLTWEDGSATGYSLELAQLTYQETKVPILKFALLEDATGKSLAYSWADVNATRVGFNLKWFQGGFTLKEKNPNMGWD